MSCPRLLWSATTRLGERPARETFPTVFRTDCTAVPPHSGMASAASRAFAPALDAPLATNSCPRDTADAARGCFSNCFAACLPRCVTPLATRSPAFCIACDSGRPL